MLCRIIALLLLLTVFGHSDTDAQVTYDVIAERPSGEMLRGPIDIELRNLNHLKYELRVGRTVTFDATMNLSLPFIPAVSPPGGAGAAAAVIADLGGNRQSAFLKNNSMGPPTFDDFFVDLVHDLGDIQQHWYEQGQSEIISFVDSSNSTYASLVSLVSVSDQLLQVGGPDNLIPRIRAVYSDVDGVLALRLPTVVIEKALAKIDAVEAAVMRLPARFGSGTWLEDNQDRYESLTQAIGAFRTRVVGAGSSPSIAAIPVSHARLRRWHTILGSLDNAEAFSRKVSVGCDYSWGRTQRIAIELVTLDRMADATTPARDVIATVECTSVLSVSAGWGVTFADVKRYGVVVSSVSGDHQASEVRSTVQIVDEMSFRPVPTILLHMRVKEARGFGGHFSVGGTIGGAQSDNGGGGADIEYLIGGSVSIARSLYISGVFHLTRIGELAGGWSVGDVVPNGVSSAPLRRGWGHGYGVLFSYKVR